MSHIVDYDALKERVGEEALSQRLVEQTKYAYQAFSRRVSWFHSENLYGMNSVINTCLKMTGCYEIGTKQFKDLRVIENEVMLEALPSSFDGFKILQLSDLHLDEDPELTDAIIECVRSRVGEFDIVALTGDYRFRIEGTYDVCLKEMRRILEVIEKPVYAVLGNHDVIEMVPYLEKMGVRVLFNEAVELKREEESIYLVGVDDPHHYQGHDFERSLRDIPESASASNTIKILLAHSPEVYREAEQHGIDYLLCGHTHAGQICFPGEIPLFINARCPRRFAKGAWEHCGLKGYTSRGTGGSGLPVRFFCPPEVTVHRLCKGRKG